MRKKPITISLLVPCYNEEKSIEASILSSLRQTRPFDEIIYIDDSSVDNTASIIQRYSERGVKYLKTPRNTGNKSSAQEFGLRFVTCEYMVTTDGDTLLDEKFVEEIERDFRKPGVFAVAGYVKSLPYNWLTLCRAFSYVIGDFHKIAQDYLNYIFVMPGAASAFNVKMFRKYITFDHDTITEDLDFTYKMHQNNLKIVYNRNAICYTQDPATLKNYINQVRRWYDGGWQNLRKHFQVIKSPVRAMELSLIYVEGFIFSILMFIVPIINPWIGLILLLASLGITYIFAIWAAWRIQRPALLLVPIPYTFLIYVNAYLFMETFIKEIVLRKKNLKWFKPERVTIEIKAEKSNIASQHISSHNNNTAQSPPIH